MLHLLSCPEAFCLFKSASLNKITVFPRSHISLVKPVFQRQLVQSGWSACQRVYLSGRPCRSLRLWLWSRDEGRRHHWHWAVQLPRFTELNELFFLSTSRLKGSVVEQTDNEHSAWLILLFPFSRPQRFEGVTSHLGQTTSHWKDTALLSGQHRQSRHDAEGGGGGWDWGEGGSRDR